MTEKLCGTSLVPSKATLASGSSQPTNSPAAVHAGTSGHSGTALRSSVPQKRPSTLLLCTQLIDHLERCGRSPTRSLPEVARVTQPRRPFDRHGAATKSSASDRFQWAKEGMGAGATHPSAFPSLRHGKVPVAQASSAPLRDPAMRIAQIVYGLEIGETRAVGGRFSLRTEGRRSFLAVILCVVKRGPLGRRSSNERGGAPSLRSWAK